MTMTDETARDVIAALKADSDARDAARAAELEDWGDDKVLGLIRDLEIGHERNLHWSRHVAAMFRRALHSIHWGTWDRWTVDDALYLLGQLESMAASDTGPRGRSVKAMLESLAFRMAPEPRKRRG